MPTLSPEPVSQPTPADSPLRSLTSEPVLLTMKPSDVPGQDTMGNLLMLAILIGLLKGIFGKEDD